MIKAMIPLLLLLTLDTFGQAYRYKRPLPGARPGWHEIVLPDALYGRIKQDMSDMRILGVTTQGDTVEAPYILRVSRGRNGQEEIAFKTINRVHDSKGYFHTFEKTAGQAINRITVQFNRANFDWRIRLEGSHDQREWFTLAEDYRILSLEKNKTVFRYTDIVFPESDFTYFRLFIPATDDPGLQSAVLSREKREENRFRPYRVRKLERGKERHARTVLMVELEQPLPVSYLGLDVTDSMDYYRPVTVTYLADSFRTERGWKYRYRRLTSGVLDSRRKVPLVFPTVTAQKLKIIINNDDNPPLHTGAVEVKGYIHTLVARFPQPANYALYYGRAGAKPPVYDIARFTDRIPDTLPPLTPDREQVLFREGGEEAALFEDPLWLWLTLGLLIVLLGGFSLKMMRDA